MVIGAGIFTITASTAGNITGPAISISFVFAAITCGLAALCYAEFASTVPVAGSAYTFSYATLRRVHRLDHRLGPDPGVRGRRGGRWPRAGRAISGTVFGFGGGTADLAGLQLDWGALLIIAFVTALLALGHEAVGERQRRRSP